MNYRIEISPLPQWRDARGEGVRKQVKDSLGIALEGVRTRDVYTVSAAISATERPVCSSLFSASNKRRFSRKSIGEIPAAARKHLR